MVSKAKHPNHSIWKQLLFLRCLENTFLHFPQTAPHKHIGMYHFCWIWKTGSYSSPATATSWHCVLTWSGNPIPKPMKPCHKWNREVRCQLQWTTCTCLYGYCNFFILYWNSHIFLCRSIVNCVAMSDPILPTYKSIIRRI